MPENTQNRISTQRDRELEPEPEPVAAYSDENASSRIISEDNKVFRVHDYYLKAFSTFFRDILFTSLCDDGGEPILHIPASASDTELLLDMMHGKTTTANIDAKQWARLAELAKQFGCDLLLERVIIPDLKAVLSKHAYHVFCSASRIQDVELAVAAIKALKHDSLLNPTPVVTDCGKGHSTYSSPLSKITQEHWQGCHGDYFFAFVKAIAEYEEEGIVGTYAWGTVAANFKNHLPKYQPTTQSPLNTQRPLKN